MGRGLSWAYGVTTVPDRRDTLLPRTLESLRGAGFPDPHLFIDGLHWDAVVTWQSLFRHTNGNPLPMTVRHPKVNAFGNWLLGMQELVIRNPACDRYAMFQDDLVAVRNLRQYLERVGMPERSYLNLHTFPQNQIAGREDFYPAPGKGLSALGLVFSREGLLTLLQQPNFVNQPITAGHRSWKWIDGGVYESMLRVGWREYVNGTSLLQHTGERSTVGNQPYPAAATFPGETFDALELLQQATSPAIQQAPPVSTH